MLSAADLAGIRATLEAALPDASTHTATILELRQPAGRDQYGEISDATAGTVVWTGEIACQLRRGDALDEPARTSTVASQGSTVVEADELVVLRFALPEAADAVPGGVGVGWTVKFLDLRGSAARTRRARIAGVVSWGEAGLADKVRLQLDSETAAT